jgi:hypothetical protein
MTTSYHATSITIFWNGSERRNCVQQSMGYNWWDTIASLRNTRCCVAPVTKKSMGYNYCNYDTCDRRSGQASVSKVLKYVRYLEGFSNRVIFEWAPVNPIFELGQRAKKLAQRSTEEGREAQDRVKMSRRTVQNAQERLRRATSQAPKTFGESVHKSTLPGLATTLGACTTTSARDRRAFSHSSVQA